MRQNKTALGAANFKVGKVDGDFGKLTEDAVRRFQKVYLPREVDGVAGLNTYRELDKVVNYYKKSPLKQRGAYIITFPNTG
ncbi:peptidoglycan-binding domain-containing protein [Bacillus sp. FSL K6-6483]